MNKNSWTRRDFIRASTGAAAVGATAGHTLLQPKPLWASPHPVAPSDRVRFAAIGTGVRGCILLDASLHTQLGEIERGLLEQLGSGQTIGSI